MPVRWKCFTGGLPAERLRLFSFLPVPRFFYGAFGTRVFSLEPSWGLPVRTKIDRISAEDGILQVNR